MRAQIKQVTGLRHNEFIIFVTKPNKRQKGQLNLKSNKQNRNNCNN